MDPGPGTGPSELGRIDFVNYSFEATPINMLCPDFIPYSPNPRQLDPTIAEHEDRSEEWQRRFLEAALVPVTARSNTFAKWQRELDRKASTSEYFNRNVNLRFAVLFQIALNFHIGGPRYYPLSLAAQDGHDQRGLPFGERLRRIERRLRTNKRLVMDVIEGIHVVRLVAGPDVRNSWLVQDSRLNDYHD